MLYDCQGVRHAFQNALNFEAGDSIREPVERTLAETLFARVKLNCHIFVRIVKFVPVTPAFSVIAFPGAGA